MKSTKKLYALAIVAHPDDESYLMSGTALVLASKKLKLGIICATRGEKGSSKLTKPVTEKQLGKIRESELRKAADIFKAARVEFLNFKDGELKKTKQADLITALIKQIEKYQPELVITFGAEGVSGHMDHIVIGEMAIAAARKSKHKPKMIWRLSRPASGMTIWNDYVNKMRVHHSHFHPQKLRGVPDQKLLRIPIAKYKNHKLRAIKCHKSQGLPAWIRLGFHRLTESMLHYEYFEVENP